MPSKAVWVTLVLLTWSLALGGVPGSAQLVVNTPGGVRSVPSSMDGQLGSTESAGSACSSGKDVSCNEPATTEPIIPVALQLFTGEVLYESLFPNLEAISEQDKRSLMSNMLATHNATISSAIGRTITAETEGTTGVHANSSRAGGAVLLAPAVAPTAAAGVQTRLLGSTAAASASNSSTGNSQATATASKVHSTASAAAAVHSSNKSGGEATDSSDSTITSDIPADVSSMPVLGGAGQTSSEVTTAAGSVAATIPVMGQYANVIVSSLKMLPINAEQFSKVSGTGAAALTWEHNLEESLVAATANATTIPGAQIQTKLTCVVNLGLELPEPPAEQAAAAATSIANKIQELTNDQSVLVGVSLIRLGQSSSGSSVTQHTLAPAAVGSAWLDTAAAAYNGSNNGSNISSNLSHIARRLAATTAASAVTKTSSAAHSSSSSVVPASDTAPALVLLSIYGVDSPANAVDVTAALQKNCPGLFRYGGSSFNTTSCGADILKAYVSAVNGAAAGAAGVASKRIMLQSKVGSRSRTANSSTHSITPSKADSRSGSTLSAGNFSASSIRVRQQPEVNIIISQAVGITANQPAADVVVKLTAFSSSFTLPQVLAKYGLAVSQAGVPQIVEIQSAGNSTDTGSDTATPAAGTSSTPSRGVSNNVVIGIAVAAALAVTAASGAAVAIVVVKQRARAARAKGTEQGLPHKKHRKGGKGKGISSKYLPTSLFSSNAPGPDHASSSSQAASSATPSGPPSLVAVQLPASLAPLSPVLSPSGTLLLPQTGPAAAAVAAAVAAAISPQRARSGPLPTGAPASPTVANLPAAVQPLTRGDSVSSAVRFDLEVDHGSSSSSSSDDGDSEEAEDHPSSQLQPGQAPTAVVAGGGTSRNRGRQQPAALGSRLAAAGRTSSDGAPVFRGSRASARLSETESEDDHLPAAAAVSAQQQQYTDQQGLLQHPQRLSTNNSQAGGIDSQGLHPTGAASGGQNISSNGCRFSNGGARVSWSSHDGNGIAMPSWWSAAADASLELMSAAAANLAVDPSAVALSEPLQQHHNPEHDALTAVGCAATTADAASLRVFSRSLSASSLQIFEAAATAAATCVDANSNGRFMSGHGALQPLPVLPHLQANRGSAGSAESSSQIQGEYGSLKSATSPVSTADSDKIPAWGGSIGTAGNSNDGDVSIGSGEKLLQSEQQVQQAAAALRPLPKPLVSPFQKAANISFMLEGL